jgi:2-C-methyl-D-erythritol 4-phosphate cytidylyltransferase
MKVACIIASGGRGVRLSPEKPKQFMIVREKPILAHTLLTFNKCPEISELILTAPNGYEKVTEDIVNAYDVKGIKRIIAGGADRQETVYLALNTIESSDIVVIHDAVRPFVTIALISQVIKEADAHGACTLGVPVKDTIKVYKKDGFALETPKRDTLWQIQTPQAFQHCIIKEAHKKAHSDGYSVTEDTALVEHIGLPVKVIMGDYANVKITTHEDLLYFR